MSLQCFQLQDIGYTEDQLTNLFPFPTQGEDGGHDHEGAEGLCERAAAGGGPQAQVPGRQVDAHRGRRRGHLHTAGQLAYNHKISLRYQIAGWPINISTNRS